MGLSDAVIRRKTDSAMVKKNEEKGKQWENLDRKLETERR